MVHKLSDGARQGEDLVAIHRVQIFEDFEHVHYPYRYKDIDGPPNQLGDLNVIGKHFRALISWDYNETFPSVDYDIDAEPKQVSAATFLSNIMFAGDTVPQDNINSISNRHRGRESGTRVAHQGDSSSLLVSKRRIINSEVDSGCEYTRTDSEQREMEGTNTDDISSSNVELTPVHTQDGGSFGGVHRVSTLVDSSLPDDSDSDKSFFDSTVKENECRHVLVVNRRRYTYRTRKRGVERRVCDLRQNRYNLSRRIDNPFLQKSRVCCKSLKCFQNVDPVYAFKVYKTCISATRMEFKRILADLYERESGFFTFQGRRVCARFLSRGFHFSNDLQSSVKNTERAAAGPSAVALPRNVRNSTNKDTIILFLREYAEEAGDKMPHRAHINLPTMTRAQVYEKFIQSFTQYHPGKSIPKSHYFYSVWKKECSEIRTRRNHSFAVCSKCELLKSKIAELQGDEDAKRALREQLKAHIAVMMEERRGYRMRSERAERFPKKYCSLILDGADQKSYGLPHFFTKSKSDKGHKIKVKCVGVLEHRKDKKLSLYPMTEEFATGANHVIEATHRTLNNRKKEFGYLPEVLYVQADNFVRENKNSFFMSYFESHVGLGVFVTVEISFLPAGHTHTDIDQSFSSVSTHLKYVNAITMEELIAELKKCYSPKAYAEPMSSVANFSGLCSKVKCVRKVKGFSKFRYFRFTRSSETHNSDGYFPTACHVKVQGPDSWSPLSSRDESNNGFLKFVPDLRSTPPTETRVPDNVTEINACLRSAEERTSAEKIRSLGLLRDRIYQSRSDSFQWDLDDFFEMNRDYLSGTGGALDE